LDAEQHKIVKLRVGNVFKTWLETQYGDFESNGTLIDNVTQFFQNSVKVDMPSLSKNLLQLIEPEVSVRMDVVSVLRTRANRSPLSV
jgi:hypothetical protein